MGKKTIGNGGHGPEGHVTDLRNIRMLETRRRKRKMEAWRLQRETRVQREL